MKWLLSVLLVLSFISCSRKSEQELMAEAQAASREKNFQLAIEKYTEVVDRFHESPAAETSQYRIATIYTNDLHDPLNGIKQYQRYSSLFPSSKEAPIALFLIGFLWNNELHQLDSARAAYDRFIHNYPDHSLATSARFELETLGKDPGTLLQPEVTSTEEVKGSEKKSVQQ